jgi:hypothetical protein
MGDPIKVREQSRHHERRCNRSRNRTSLGKQREGEQDGISRYHSEDDAGMRDATEHGSLIEVLTMCLPWPAATKRAFDQR